MARFLVTTLGATGHVLPFVPVVTRLVERGHEVRWHTDARHGPMVRGLGATLVATRHAPSAEEVVAKLAGKTRWRAGSAFAEEMLVAPLRGQLADCRDALAQSPADVVLGDAFTLCPRLLHETGGPPWANLGVSVCMSWTPDVAPHGLGMAPTRSALGRLRNRALSRMVTRRVYAGAHAELDRIRAELGLAPTPRGPLLHQLVSPYLHLQPTTQAFEYPRRPPPATLRFIGPLTPPATEEFVPPAWWGDLPGDRPVVLVTHGTLSSQDGTLVAPAVAGLADEPVLVVVTTGNAPVALPDPLPSNVRVADFIPYAALLPHVSAMVTNGGYGAVQSALAHGVPLVGAGRTEEKPEICRRIAWSGAGIRLRYTGRPTPRQVREAVRSILGDPRYRRRAEEIRADFATHDAPAEAAALLERLAETRTPVG